MEAPTGSCPRSRSWRDSARSRPFDSHVAVCFASLVQALAELRSRASLSDEVFLGATSTDPGPLLERLRNAAVRRLNSPLMVERWSRAMGA